MYTHKFQLKIKHPLHSLATGSTVAFVYIQQGRVMNKKFKQKRNYLFGLYGQRYIIYLLFLDLEEKVSRILN